MMRLTIIHFSYSTLKMIPGHLEGIASDKNTQHQHLCVYIKTYMYVIISRDFSLLLANQNVWAV